MASKSENRRINLYINGKEVKNDIRSIRNEYFKLINEQARMLRGSKEYYQHGQAIKQLKGILDEHGKQLGRMGKAWQNIKQIMMGVVGGNILTSLFQRITMAIPNLIGSLAKLSDSFADVAKTTGLTTEQVKELHSEFKSIDTRSSRKELLDLARIAGKLGIEGKKNIFDFVKAADQIKVALSEDLGGNAEDAINQIGKLVDVFKLKNQFGLEEAMLKTGSAINALGAASTASEGYLVEFSKRVAGIAPMAKISIENVLGLAATLDQLGQASEVSSTVYSQVVPDMFKDTATYAKVAGMSVDDFTSLLNTDANEAFIKVLEGLNGNNEGLSTMVGKLDELGIEGKRSIGVLGVLANNTQLLRDQQKLSNDEFEKGTSLTEEFNKKNENMAANLEKLGKWISGKFMSSGFVSFLENMVDRAAEYIKVPLSEKLEVERDKMNLLVNSIISVNYNQEIRNSLIKDLQDNYPDFLKNLDAEKVTNEQLLSRLKDVNREYEKRIKIAVYEEELIEIEERGKEIFRQQKQTIEDVNSMYEKYVVSKKEGLSLEEKLFALQKEQIDAGSEFIDAYTDYAAAENIVRFSAISTEKTLNNLSNEKIDLEKQYQDILQERAKINLSTSGAESPIQTIVTPGKPITSGGKGGGTKTTTDKFNPASIGNEEISAIIELNKQKQQAYAEGREQIVADLQASYDQETIIRQTAHNNELAQLGSNQEARKALDEQFKKEEALRLTDHLNELAKTVENILTGGGIDGINIEDAMLTDEEKDSLLSKLDELKLKLSEINAETSGLNEDGEKTDPFGMTQADWDALMENVNQAGQIAFQLADIWSSINQRIANEENANLALYEKNNEDKKKALEKQLKAGIISQKQYNEKIASLDENLDAEKKKVAQEQAKRQRTLTIFQILANGAMAAINALATTQPFILGLAMAALAAIATAAAISAVPKVPEFASGGFTKGDKVYRAGEAGQEWIAPNWMTEHPYVGPVIRNLESVRSGAAPEAVFRQPVIPSAETDFTRTSTGTNYNFMSQNDSKMDRIIEQQDKLLEYLSDPENRKAYIKYDDLSKYSKEIQTMQELSGF